MQPPNRPPLTRRAALAGAAALVTAAALPVRAAAVPERTHFPAIVIGTGFGGSVAAAHLGAAGVDTLVLERGRAYRHDDHAAVYASGVDVANPNALWAPALGRTGVLDVEPAGTVGVARGAAVGGGSVVYHGATVPPHPRYYDKVFRHGPRYPELIGEYVPRAVRRLRAAAIPDDVRRSRPFAGMVEFEESMARAGWPCASLLSTVDWGVVRRELRGEVRPSMTAGEIVFGNSNGSKRELSSTYLGAALASGRIRLRTLQRVTGLTQERDRVAVHVDELAASGTVVRRRTYTCDELYLGAGSWGTTELLLNSRIAGGLTRMNEHVGTSVGDNGNQLSARFVARPPEIQAAPIVTSAFVDDDPHHLPVRVETAGLPLPLPVIGYFTETVDWENRTSWTTVGGRAALLVAPEAITRDAGAANARVLRRVTDANGGIALDPLPGIPVPGPVPALGTSMNGLPFSVTAHPLGGVPLGLATDDAGRLRGHPAIRVVDGALNPGNAGGANPSLVITAFAEYVMDRARRAA
ncbi:GMC oxidoreductase [Tsukamurella spumae]|uniref:Cholesterol oxidase n=1 Tax=Tsukamurella spumae TaxID=44753 RepID=A0A846X0Y2_9ACTN|nr:GMC oxidoreductase [Tsukamurella spumae]NKY18246.1 GMC family oxidoreductase [Tsukamurella spumae]